MSADEMFEELGYKILFNKDNAISYFNYKQQYEIVFDKKYKSVYFAHDIGEQIFGNTLYGTLDIDFDVIKAINEKCKELGWL